MTIKEIRKELARLKLLPQTPGRKLQIQRLQQRLDRK
jgi:hypothetical protein